MSLPKLLMEKENPGREQALHRAYARVRVVSMILTTVFDDLYDIDGSELHRNELIDIEQRLIELGDALEAGK